MISLSPQRFLEELKEKLTRCEEKGEGVVVVLSFGEVNTVRDLIHEQSQVLRRRNTTSVISKGRIHHKRRIDSTALR